MAPSLMATSNSTSSLHKQAPPHPAAGCTTPASRPTHQEGGKSSHHGCGTAGACTVACQRVTDQMNKCQRGPSMAYDHAAGGHGRPHGRHGHRNREAAESTKLGDFICMPFFHIKHFQAIFSRLDSRYVYKSTKAISNESTT
jgi:hypothetical protein